jgi:hypothetical protein
VQTFVFRDPPRRSFAKARRPERPSNAAARRLLVRELGPLWASVVDGFRFDVQQGEIQAVLGGRGLDEYLRPLEGRTRSYMAQVFRRAIQAGAAIGARHSGRIGDLPVSGTGLTRRMTRWIERSGAARVTRINRATREGVREAVANVLRTKLDPARAARLIGDATGLTPQQVRSLAAYEARITAARIPIPAADTALVRQSIADDVARRRETLLQQRGDMIVETEAQSAIHAGERAYWDTQIEEGNVARDRLQKRWYTVEDERVCELCEPLHRQIKAFDEPFISQGTEVMGPPMHPRCRCYLDYSATGFDEDA